MKHSSKIIILSIFVLFTTSLFGQPNLQENLVRLLDKLKTSLNEHKFEIIEPFLAGEFSYNSYSGEMAHVIMQQIVEQ